MLKSTASIIFILLLLSSLNAAEMILHENERYLNAFYTQVDKIGWKVELKGKITSIGAREYSRENELAQRLEDKTKITVRLYNNTGIDKGDIIYVIDNKNLIIGKLLVVSVFYSKSLGYIMTGEGNLRLANINDRVVKRIEQSSGNSVLYNSKGDYYYENGELGEAISQYKSAIEIDSRNPESHINLGYIYLKKELLQLAALEFKEAEKNQSRIIDNEDKYLLFKGLTEVRYKEAYYTRLSDELRNKYITEGIKYSKKALEIYPDSGEVNFYLGIFYYKNINPSDVKAKDHFLKVIAVDQDNVDAYIALSELYEKHKNKSKAISYAEKALEIDPASDRAKFILNKLK